MGSINVRARAWALAAGLLAPSLAVAAPASTLFYERTVMLAADARCGLFDPAIASALAAAQAQARGAALRSGLDRRALDGIEAEARTRAGAADCRSADIATAAGRVRQAFAGYAQLTRMTYPGDAAEWRADRTAAGGVARWGLTQDVKFGWDRMVFGIAGRDERRLLMSVVNFADGRTPYAARLVLRDTTRASQPYIDARNADARGRVPLADRMPPRTVTLSYAAEARSPAAADLRPSDMETALAFRFPAAAANALASLDPREAVAVEFVFAGRNGDEVRTAYVEVGDFAAARAFLTLAQR
jgi:hypothetical protein